MFYSISGKSRKKQFALAAGFGLKGYGTPAGGCLLTDPAFSRKVKDAIAHGGLTPGKSGLLKTGRHFRLETGGKLIIPRNEKEDVFLRKSGAKFIILEPKGASGPSAVLFNDGDIEEAASVLAHYAKRTCEFSVIIKAIRTGVIEAAAMKAGEIKKRMV